MPRRTTLQHTLIAALAASIVAASPALAKPTDRVDRFDSRTSSLAGTTSSPRQDLRNEYSRDAARAAEMRVHPGQPIWPTDPEPVVKPAEAVPAPETGGEDDVWLVVGIGLAATGIAAGATGAARRHRLRARRVAA